MAFNVRTFLKKIRLLPDDVALSQPGELKVSTSGKLEYRNNTDASPVVTEAHSATLTNKTIDADNNSISNVELTSLKTELLDANKIIRRDGTGVVVSDNTVPNSNEIVTIDASQSLSNKTISVDENTISGIATNSFVLTDSSGNVDGGASQKAIPTGTVVGTTDTQTLTNKSLEDSSTFIKNTSTDAFLVFNSAGANSTYTEIVAAQTNPRIITLPDATTTLVGLDTADVLFQKTLDSPIINSANVDNIFGQPYTPLLIQSTPGYDLSLNSPDTGKIEIQSKLAFTRTTPINTAGALDLPTTVYALVSDNIDTIAQGVNNQFLIITNTSTNSITIANEAAPTTGILTGTGGSIALLPNSSLILIYNLDAGYWYVIGGVGGASTFNIEANASVLAFNPVYVDSADSDKANPLYAGDDSKIEFVGIALDNGGGSIRVQVSGEVDIPDTLIEDPGNNFVVGKPVYASVNTPGKYSSTVPNEAGNWVVPVGIATAARKLSINGAGSSTAVKLTSVDDPYVYANVLATSSDTTLNNGNSIVLVNASGGSRTITLPSPTSGKIFNIKKTDSSVNTVTISPPSGTIDGAASKALAFQYDSLTITSDGTNFFII